MSQQGKTRLDKVSMFAFSYPVLLRSVWTGHTVRDPRALKITMQFMVLATPIRLNGYDFSVK